MNYKKLLFKLKKNLYYFIKNPKSIINENDNFMINSFQVSQSQTNIITINPFYFPTSHAPLHLHSTFSTHILDLLENEIEKSHRNSVIVCHYPSGFINSKKSSSGKNFKELIYSYQKVLCFLSGHWHPRKPTSFHYGNGWIEIMGTVGYINSMFGIVSIDNDCIV